MQAQCNRAPRRIARADGAGRSSGRGEPTMARAGGAKRPAVVPDSRAAGLTLSRRLERLPLADRVYETLQDGMLEGTIPAGTHLVQDTIAEQLGVSRTPVREALIRLAQDELIVAAGARGYVVVEPASEPLSDILQVRMLLEPAGAGEALEHMSERDFRYLSEVNAKFTDNPGATGRELYEFNREFHMGLVEKCPNTLLVDVLESCWRPARSRWISKFVFEDGFDMTESAREHEEIIEVARSRDRQAFEELLRRHISDVRGHVPVGEGDA
jgi:DNA-binding GntR family transcriptional regulator